MFQNLHRSVLFIKYKLPFLNWLNSSDPDDTTVPENNGKIYLLPEFETEEEIQGWIAKNYKILFKEQIQDWADYKKWGPKNLTFKMFTQWFEYRVYPEVSDVVNEPITKYNWYDGLDKMVEEFKLRRGKENERE